MVWCWHRCFVCLMASLLLIQQSQLYASGRFESGSPPIDLSVSLEEVLEYGSLGKACEAYKAKPNDYNWKLKCGKFQFFYDPLGTEGVPGRLLLFLLKHFKELVGPGFSRLGMIADPYSERGLPIGMAATRNYGDRFEAFGYTCASCHFAKLKDGRYSVGAGNFDFEYGKKSILVGVFPRLVTPFTDMDKIHPGSLELLAPYMKVLNNNKGLSLRFAVQMLPLVTAGEKVPVLAYEVQDHYLSWPPGVMDFFMSPAYVDDGVHIASKVQNLWEIPRPREWGKHGMPHGMLGSTGGTFDVLGFVKEFVRLGGGVPDDYKNEDYGPMVEYIYSLKAPPPLRKPPAEHVAMGEKLFAERCIGCHGGSSFEGDRIYSFAEMGTDDALRYWLDGWDLDGEPCCGLEYSGDSEFTYGVKSPRLKGLFSVQTFLHNGSVTSLEELFCIENDRLSRGRRPHSKVGHRQTCDHLELAEKKALISYLKSL